MEDHFLDSNPASRVGKFARREPREQEAAAMTRAEAEGFLLAVQDVYPDWYLFLLTALRAGLWGGELIALRFGAFTSEPANGIPTDSSCAAKLFSWGLHDAHKEEVTPRRYVPTAAR